jgi:putrescine aminotransferase
MSGLFPDEAPSGTGGPRTIGDAPRSDAPRSAAGQVFQQARRHFSLMSTVAGRLAGGGAVEVSATGSRVLMSDGRSVLDFGSYAVPLLGHRHPAVVDAVMGQLQAMPTATRTLTNPVAVAAAARLAGYLGGALPRVYFGLNGADAVEAAVKLARLASGRTKVLAVRGAYHGKSLGALALTHHPRFRAGLHDCLAEVVHLDPADPDAVAREVSRGPAAALVFEPVQGENGVVHLDVDVLRAWCASAIGSGAFVIADEVQSGLRRCGERSVALAEGLPVDAVLLGKSLGGGVMPLSAMVCGDRLFAPLASDPVVHTATFSGHPLACSALPATLDAIEELADRGRRIAEVMAAGLAAVAIDRPDVVGEVRGRGLLWGVDFLSPQVAADVLARLPLAGLLVSPCLSSPATLRLLPPLVATDEDLDSALDILDGVMTAVSRRH